MKFGWTDMLIEMREKEKQDGGNLIYKWQGKWKMNGGSEKMWNEEE